MQLGFLINQFLLGPHPKTKKLRKQREYCVSSTNVVARYRNNGNPKDVIKLEPEARVSPSEKDVEIKMLFSPINPGDINVIQGSYPRQQKLPSICGSEGVGEVVRVGSQVSKLKVGDVVLPIKEGFGTWRKFATCKESDVFPVKVPEDVPLEYIASASINVATAYRLLEDFVSLKEGDVIIQNGANGMVGATIIQLAAAKGIKSINIIRPRSDFPDQVEKLKGYGAYMVISDDYVKKFEFRNLISDLPKPKLALNCVGGDSATEMARLLGKNGTMVTYGGMSLKPVIIPSSLFIFNDINLKGFWMSQWYESHTLEERINLLNKFIQLIDSHKLRLWSEKHEFVEGFDTALDRAINSFSRDRKVLLKFE